MDIRTYTREAARFDNHRAENVLDALAHGLVAEVGEVLDCVTGGQRGVELLHELGDVMWNLVRLADEVGHDPELFTGRGQASSDIAAACGLVAHASKVCGVLERSHRATPAPWDPRQEIARHLDGVWQALCDLCERHGYSARQVRRTNIDKLTARYAERGLPVKEVP